MRYQTFNVWPLVPTSECTTPPCSPSGGTTGAADLGGNGVEGFVKRHVRAVEGDFALQTGVDQEVGFEQNGDCVDDVARSGLLGLEVDG
ncbi:MAG TPA: hypothetical protein VGJ81_09805 [Thermoanaerobaculia bacterium]